MPIRVVIVDDTDSMRELMRSHIEQSGDMEIVGEAVDGLDAVAVVRRTQPDAVILDVEMPVMDGLQALPGIRAAAPSSKIIVFSSRAEQPTAAAARQRGAEAVFFKGQAKSGDVVAHLRELFTENEESA